MEALSSKSRYILKRVSRMSEGPKDAKWYSVTEIIKILVNHPITKAEMENEDDHTLSEITNIDAMADVKNMRLLLDDLVIRDYLERRELPEVQYRRVMKAKPWPVEDVREILKKHSSRTVVSGFSEEGVVLVDLLTASLLITVYDNLSETNQEKYASRDVVEATNLAWKLVDSGAVSGSHRSG